MSCGGLGESEAHGVERYIADLERRCSERSRTIVALAEALRGVAGYRGLCCEQECMHAWARKTLAEHQDVIQKARESA